MNKKLEKAIESLSEKATSSKTSHEAMQYAQAALNLAHAVATLEGAKSIIPAR